MNPNDSNGMNENVYKADAASGKKQGGAHAKPAQSAYIQRSSRMRKVLIVVIVLLVILLGAVGFFGFQIFQSAQDAAVQQAQTTEIDTITDEESENDASSATSKKTTVPDLVSLLGRTQEEAITLLKHGAEVTRTMEVNEESNPARLEIQIALTDEPSDSRSGTPTVYASLNEAGIIIEAGYSAATSSLGYGSVSFADAVQNEHIVEETLAEAGLTVNYGTAQLPADKMEYSTYDTDGTTLVKEYCSFQGTGMAEGVEHHWDAILSYDYSVANATDNLNDTIRTIYIYIS